MTKSSPLNTMTTVENTIRSPDPVVRPIARWIGLGLLSAELIGLTLLFDTASLGLLCVWWVTLLRASAIYRVAITVAAATALVGGPRLRTDLRRGATSESELNPWPFLVGHVAALVALSGVTAYVLEGGARDSLWAPVVTIGWLMLAALTLASWLAAVLPSSRWLPVARRSAVPLLGSVFIGLAAWGLGCLTDRLWLPLSRSTFWLVVRLLGLITSDCICDPDALVVGTSTFSVEIAPVCSGYEGIGLVWVFVGVYLWGSRSELRFPAALAVLPAATVAIWLANAGRIASLVAVGTWVSEEAALGGFHSQAGWLAFNAVALGVVFVADRVPWIRKAGTSVGRAEVGKPEVVRAYLAPLMVLTATMMFTRAFVSDFDWAYPLRVVTTGAVLWYYRRAYAGFIAGWSWVAVSLGVSVFLVWLLLAPAPPPGKAVFPEALNRVSTGWAVLWLIFRVAGTVITVPLAEELAFRGFLTRRLISSNIEEVTPGRFTWVSFLASSVLFGLLHGRWLAGTLAGMAYALALYRRGRVSDAVLAHTVTNALLAAYVLIAGAWWLW